MKDWIMELCPEIAEWQAEAIEEYHKSALKLATEAAVLAQGEPVLWVNPNLDRVTTDRKLAEKNGLYIPLYAGPTVKESLPVQDSKEIT